MTMLHHSVWSGGGSAAGRRRSLLALGALLALMASVLIWAAPSHAQNESPPVAIAALGTATTTDGVITQTLNGAGSFDPDGGDVTYKWEVVTADYSWVALLDGDNDTATAPNTESAPKFTVPSKELAERYGNVIEFKLTVTDNDAPAATASDTLTYNINQGPTADIAVSAMLADPANPDVAGYDDNGNGVKDENAERYPLDGLIDGPGENGNADNEWDIAEGSLLVLDGSGSSDPNGRLVAAGHDWTLVYPTAADAYTSSLPGGDDSATDSRTATIDNKKKISTDADDQVASATGETLKPLTQTSGKPVDSYYVYYKLTVNDGAAGTGGATNSAVVKIVIHDQPANPRVATLVPSVTDATDGVSKLSTEVVPPKSGKYVIAPGSKITVTATASDADGDTPTVSWEGAQATAPAALTANFAAPATAEEGDEFTITATATDITGRTGTKSVVLVVATNTAPEAVAPGTPDPDPSPFSRITRNDGPDGGDVNPATGKGTGTVKLRGVGFDADGDPLIYNWTELTFPTYERDHDNDTSTPTVTTLDSVPRFTTPGDPTTLIAGSGTPGEIKLPRKAVLTIDNAFSDEVSFAVPEVSARHIKDAAGNLVIPIAFTVIDKWSVKHTDIVIVTITQDDDDPVADAGPDQRVTSGSFVRLNGSGSSDSDPGDKIKYSWRYVGVVLEPLTNKREPITAAEQGYGYVEGQWFPYDGISHICVGTSATATKVQVFSNHTLGATAAESTSATADGCAGLPHYSGASASDAGSDNADWDHDGDNTTDDIKSYPVDFKVLPDGSDTDTEKEDAKAGHYVSDAGGKLKGDDTAYPYFDAPKIGAFDSVRLVFWLSVLDGQNTTTTADDDWSLTDAVVITVTDGFYSGQITGPEFCLDRSLGGPATYAFDSDGDGVADICSLNTTRRAAVARQNALETLAALNPGEFKDALHVGFGIFRKGTCAVEEWADLGDTEAELAADSCGNGKKEVSSPPPPVDPAKADVFFSGVVTGPSYCTNMSLGGPKTYAFDSDGDGVADVCSLPFTRREAVARQFALHWVFGNHDQYKSALAAACAALGTTDFGDSAADLAKDECDRPPAAATGTPLPSSS